MHSVQKKRVLTDRDCPSRMHAKDITEIQCTQQTVHEGCKYCAILGHLLLHTAFLRLDTTATIFFTACYWVATIRGQCLFRQKTRRHQCWIRYERYSDDY